MRKLSHVGIPTQIKQADESYMESAKLFLTNYATSPNKIEFLRFEEGSDFPQLIQDYAHIAYEVDDLEAEMKGKKILIEPFDAGENLTIAFIEEEGIAIELMLIK